MMCPIIFLCLFQGYNTVDINLIRYGSTPMGTFGEMHVGSHVFQTVERPYLGNARRISSVPAGRYRLEPHKSESKWIGETYALVNEDLGVYHWDVPEAKRSAILIHIANHMHQLEGCIGVGMRLGVVAADGEMMWAVNKSTSAMRALRDTLSQGDNHFINISYLQPEEMYEN